MCIHSCKHICMFALYMLSPCSAWFNIFLNTERRIVNLVKRFHVGVSQQIERTSIRRRKYQTNGSIAIRFLGYLRLSIVSFVVKMFVLRRIANQAANQTISVYYSCWPSLSILFSFLSPSIVSFFEGNYEKLSTILHARRLHRLLNAVST